MKLYCVRHGHAESMPDATGENPLTPQGRQEVTQVAQYLGERGVHVAHVMHSHKLRAKQTAEIFSHFLAHDHATELCDFLNPENSIDNMIEAIQSWHDDALVVGHMPFMSHLVSALIVGNEAQEIVAFPPGTVVCLSRHNHQWILSWVLRPDLICHVRE